MIILPHRGIPANTDQFPLTDLEAVLTTAYDTDAHYALYEPRDETISSLPRLTKADSESVLLRALAQDYDLPNHGTARADDGTKRELEIFFEDHPDLVPTYFHLTRAGARLLWTLPQALTPEQYESVHQQMVQRFASRGLQLDPGVWQWNRLFRAPNVVRDGETFSPKVYSSGQSLDLSTYDLTQPPRGFSPVRLNEAMPTIQDAQKLMWMGSQMTAWHKKAKRRLQNRMDGEIDPCFERHPAAWPSPRNDTMMRCIGSATSLLYGQIDTTPERLYSLFLERTLQSQQSDGRNLLAELWKMILYCWGHEMAREEHETQEREEAQKTLQEITQDPDVLERLIVRTTRGTYYVMKQDGYYDRLSCCRDLLPGVMQEQGLDKVIDLTVTNSHGTRPLRPDEILNRYAMRVEPEIQKRPGVSPELGGWLEGRSLVFGAYARRTDLKPTYSPDVDKWLKIMFPVDQFEGVCRWIGAALNFEGGPICALSVASPPGVGKGLFVAGLTEATDPPTPSASGSVFGKYQYRLEDTPWVHVDETWPRTTENIAQTLKSLIGEGVVDIHVKYGHMRPLAASPRILLMANNRSMIEKLFQAPDLTQSDVSAVAKRVYHVDCTNDAALYLEKMGSYRHTAGWVKSDYGPSQFTLAKHFLWIYEQHKHLPPMGRFLVEDMTSPSLVAWLTVKNRDVAFMAEALVCCLGNARVEYRDDGVWVSVGDVKHMLDMFVCPPKKYTAMEVGRHLRLLTTDKDPTTRQRKIDMEKIRWFANETGTALPERAQAAA